MKLGARGEALIKSFEDFHFASHNDGTGTWSIGWGHTRSVHPGITITLDTAERYFRADIHLAECALNLLNVPLTQSQFDALISLIFDVGPSAISGRSTIGKALRDYDWYAAWRGFALWATTHTQARRRTAEMSLFLEDGT